MLEAFSGLIDTISGYMYSYILIIMLLAVGLYFTFRGKLVQLRLLPESIRVVTEKPKDSNSVSAFQALMVSTASRVGTGNIVGVATAIASGGYGAVQRTASSTAWATTSSPPRTPPAPRRRHSI